ncbi:hypothetical protein BJP34_12310 [Moorena producens PAL-8-15-08-1]|uniref:Uncharacterized protein n=1 Tax=Moorena producens PAL-8-15-08-1 TaxID=1458985 RepID=A0A1D8TRS2_9CYAN|nr:hypothetical protein [Moorena producens]AOX00126.1 hypothetical protein BJP34_12310 [Moorena producens PAL-8-15-08-1]
MSLSKQNIEAFIHIIKYQPSLFSEKNIVDLKQQIDKFPEDVESLSDAISTWCKEYRDIRKALSKTRTRLFGSTPRKQMGPGESNPKPKPEDYKTNIKNQMRESFPETTPEATKEQKPPDSSK